MRLCLQSFTATLLAVSTLVTADGLPNGLTTASQTHRRDNNSTIDTPSLQEDLAESIDAIHQVLSTAGIGQVDDDYAKAIDAANELQPVLGSWATASDFDLDAWAAMIQACAAVDSCEIIDVPTGKPVDLSKLLGDGKHGRRDRAKVLTLVGSAVLVTAGVALIVVTGGLAAPAEIAAASLVAGGLASMEVTGVTADVKEKTVTMVLSFVKDNFQ
ncbi:hypothetical protein PV05_06904 [Exophiala xenobiotica]|uniref:Transmembrane protein n=1 Tax=Exophiala xenobiotica TaxID=348802 RepID=A0A0D2CWM7_9EURO|nr:uncharacterized protein PV05_06904 [Exophiala xenobiotica]KIW54552.1 hypothetical protein PV05_06904 [Exophiala xenobiotica]